LSAEQLSGWSKINMGRRRRTTENKTRMKEEKKEIVVYNKSETKYADKLPIKLSECRNKLSR
jgi:hypothetical protein